MIWELGWHIFMHHPKDAVPDDEDVISCSRAIQEPHINFFLSTSMKALFNVAR
jgi:hypothetical protein